MTKVGIFLAGYSECRIGAVVRLLSVRGSNYVFEAGPRIEVMGDPDLYDLAYSDQALLGLVEQYRDEFDICAILTAVPIDDNFFTRTVGLHTIISTSFLADELIQRSGRSLCEYFGLAICQELLSIAFQRASGLSSGDLFHQDTRGCLFDFAGYRPHKIAKLKRCWICPQSRGLLARYNVDNRVLSLVEDVLKRIRKPSVRKSLLSTVTSPILAFVYGGVVVGLAVSLVSSLVFTTSPLTREQEYFIWLLAACVPLVPLVVHAWAWIGYLRSRH